MKNQGIIYTKHRPVIMVVLSNSFTEFLTYSLVNYAAGVHHAFIFVHDLNSTAQVTYSCRKRNEYNQGHVHFSVSNSLNGVCRKSSLISFGFIVEGG